jgi:hypothetical protein
MYKTKLFTRSDVDDTIINKWLAQNQNIGIISTSSFANLNGWGYIILYKECEDDDE